MFRGTERESSRPAQVNFSKQETLMDNRIKLAVLAGLLGCAAAYAGEQAPAQQQPATSAAPATDRNPPPSSETTATTPMPEFSTLDVNGDGVVSQEEAKDQASLSAIFNDVDANHDGKLDSREYAEARNRLER
jgi:hypothetical protein